jgi:toxin ParE1/3/4
MTRKLIIRDRATQDLRKQANYILVNGTTAAAERYLEMADKTFMQLLTTPGLGKVVGFVPDRMGGVRQWRIKMFTDYLVFYRAGDDRIEILRVLHGARDLEEILSQLDDL